MNSHPRFQSSKFYGILISLFSFCDTRASFQCSNNKLVVWSSLFDARRVFDNIIHIRATAPWIGTRWWWDTSKTERTNSAWSSSKRCAGNASQSTLALTPRLSKLATLWPLSSSDAPFTENSARRDPSVTTYLVDLYGKCGNTDAAQLVFDSAPAALLKNVAAWNVLLSGYSRQGNHAAVLELFYEMLQSGECLPNAVSFLAVLSACRHAGLVDTGKKFFDAMPGRYGVDPQLEHFHSTVDLLGRGNRLDEALELVESMPHKNTVTWTTLLSASCMWRNEEIGRLSFERLVALDKTRAAAYVLMAGIYESKPVSE